MWHAVCRQTTGPSDNANQDAMRVWRRARWHLPACLAAMGAAAATAAAAAAAMAASVRLHSFDIGVMCDFLFFWRMAGKLISEGPFFSTESSPLMVET